MTRKSSGCQGKESFLKRVMGFFLPIKRTGSLVCLTNKVFRKGNVSVLVAYRSPSEMSGKQFYMG